MADVDDQEADWLQIIPGLAVREPPELKPEVPPEIWNDTPVDPQRAWAAVVAMCG